MKKNFKIDQSNALMQNSKIYDIHNCYNLVQVQLSSNKKNLEIIFDPHKLHGKGLKPLKLIFEDIDFLQFSSSLPIHSPNQTIDEFGYKAPKDNDDSWLMDETQSNPNDHLFIRIEDNEFIRVHSKRANLIPVILKINLEEKALELKTLLEQFFLGKVSNKELKNFSWEMIHYFTDAAKDQLPKESASEKPFWHAIWQIQHLCDESHENDEITKTALLKSLSYLNGEKKMPKSCTGQRP